LDRGKAIHSEWRLEELYPQFVTNFKGIEETPEMITQQVFEIGG
jgi:hypothetical protein